MPVPWRLSAASPAYAGIANSWNCAASYEGPRHMLHGEHSQGKKLAEMFQSVSFRISAYRYR